jgi:hypothetical protein
MWQILVSALWTNKNQNRCKLKIVPLTRKGMVAAARDASYSDVSDRLVTDWVSLGLLDEPERTARGKGQGRGAFYEWPETQRDLFLTLLAQRPDAPSRAAMCAIPVGIWMYWGDEWIPLRQVRRALRTWWDRPGRIGWQRSLEAARLVVDTLAPAGTSRAAKSELRELVAGALENHVFPREAITESVRQLLDARSSDGAWGPYRTPPSEVVDGMWSMAVAIDRYQELTDGMFYEARSRLRPIMMSYAADWPTLSRQPGYGQSYEQPTWEFLINRSPPQLLAGLGLQLLAQEDRRSLGPVPIQNWTRPPDVLARLPISETNQQITGR